MNRNYWLVTGGAGFIGTNFVYRALEKSDIRLVVLDALTYAGNLANIKPLIDADKIEFVHGDICDAELVGRLFQRYAFTRVFHFAAESHVDRSILEPAAFIKTNIEGTFVLLNSALTTWAGDMSGKLFIHVSTDEVFGDLEPDDPPFDESTAYKPSSPYSASKAASDHIVRAWHRTYGLPAIITNCSNNYGPWQFPEKFIPLMIINALEGKGLPLYGDGLQIRDWLHVDDHCDALLAIAGSGQPGETYTIGGRCERTNLSVLHFICDSIDTLRGSAAGTSRRLIESVTDRPGHDRRYAISADKLTRDFDWRPRHRLEDEIGKLIAWYQSHGSWVQAIRSGEYKTFYDQLYGSRLNDGIAKGQGS